MDAVWREANSEQLLTGIVVGRCCMMRKPEQCTHGEAVVGRAQQLKFQEFSAPKLIVSANVPKEPSHHVFDLTSISCRLIGDFLAENGRISTWPLATVQRIRKPRQLD